MPMEEEKRVTRSPNPTSSEMKPGILSRTCATGAPEEADGSSGTDGVDSVEGGDIVMTVSIVIENGNGPLGSWHRRPSVKSGCGVDGMPSRQGTQKLLLKPRQLNDRQALGGQSL